MPCEWQITRISFVVEEMDTIINAPSEFTQSQLLDLINHWSYTLSYITIHDYEVRYHRKQFFRRLKEQRKEIEKLSKEPPKLDEEGES